MMIAKTVRRLLAAGCLASGTCATFAVPAKAQECVTTQGADTSEAEARDLSCGEDAAARPGAYREGLYRPDGFDETQASVAVGQLAWSAGTNNTVVGSAAMAGTLQIEESADLYGIDYHLWVLNPVQQATAIGASAKVQADFATALGAGAIASGQASIAIGHRAQAPAQDAVAIGTNALASEPGTVSFGNEGLQRRLVNIADGIASSDAATVGQLDAAVGSVGNTADAALAATQTNAVAIAGNTSAIASNASAIAQLEVAGAAATAELAYFAVDDSGQAAVASGQYAIAIGDDAVASGTSAFALGDAARAIGYDSLALGHEANADQTSSIAIGRQADVRGRAGLAVGHQSAAARQGSAYGYQAVAQGTSATALGYIASADGQQAFAGGAAAQADGLNATALGSRAVATGTSATALGSRATATHERSTAVGAGAVTTADNQVMLGGAGSSVVIADIASSTNAQQGPVDVVTIDANGVLGRQAAASQRALVTGLDKLRSHMDAIAAVTDAQFAALTTNVTALTGRVDRLEQGLTNTNFRLDALDQAMRAGVAAAMAHADAPMPSAAGRTSYVGKGSTFRGEFGFSLGLTHRLGDERPFAIMAGISHAGDKNTGGTLGVMGEF